MSNETANRSHAGLVLQMFLDPGFNPSPPAGPPRILAAWGFDVASLIRVPSDPPGQASGLYSIRLTQPASGLIGPTAIEVVSIDSVILSSTIAQEPGRSVNALLLPDPALPAPVVGQRAQLPILALQVVELSGQPFDAEAVIQLEVRRVPQQD